jgi:tRNA threonylcarbamoyladenosine biosynthesis protein TsaB
MSTILAIETSTEVASVALLRGQTVAARTSHGVQTHSDTVLPLIHALLGEAGVRLDQCDAIAFGEGPGSFTGVRTACGIVQGLAFGADVPVVPVVTLLAMAQGCRHKHGDVAVDVVPVIDARMGEVYWAQYRFEAGAWQEIVAPVLSTADAVSPIGQAVVCGNGVSAYPAAFEGRDWVKMTDVEVMPHAADIAGLAIGRVQAGDVLPAEAAQPLYLRNKVALTTAERQIRDAAKGVA